MKERLLALLILSTFISLAQETQLDSINHKLGFHTKKDTIRLDLLLESSELAGFDEPILAIQKAEEAFNIAKQLKRQDYQSKAILAKGTAYYRMDNLNKALSHYQESLDIAQKTSDTLLQSEVLNNI
ncbi:MAG: hypothetical protein V7767_07670, partial [Leeuwenhoekiella sp.]